jgi:hypothetical protein
MNRLLPETTERSSHPRKALEYAPHSRLTQKTLNLTRNFVLAQFGILQEGLAPCRFINQIILPLYDRVHIRKQQWNSRGSQSNLKLRVTIIRQKISIKKHSIAYGTAS